MTAILLHAINIFITLLIVLIMIRALLSWFPGGEASAFGRWIVFFTEPLLGPIRRLLMKFEFARSMPLDFSPFVAWVLLIIVQRIAQILL